MTFNIHLNVIILAAGKGTRMQGITLTLNSPVNNPLPKPLYQVANVPVIKHIINAVQPLNPKNIAVVINQRAQPSLQSYLVGLNLPNLSIFDQPAALGTGDAAKAATKILNSTSPEVLSYTLILCGDTPLITTALIQGMLNDLETSAGSLRDMVIGCMRLAHPGSYGRVQCALDGTPIAIIEAKDATSAQLQNDLCYGGVMIIADKWLSSLLPKLTNNNSKQEYYLTDLVQNLSSYKGSIVAHITEADLLHGINTPQDLTEAERLMQERLRMIIIAKGGKAETNSYISADAIIGFGLTLEPWVYIGNGVEIGDNVTLRSFSYLDNTKIHDHAIIGPFAHLRPGAVVGENAKVGNFVEIKNSIVGDGTKINHLSYIGDTTIGKQTNIGAGTIICNYDGIKKHSTTIGDGAFIGSNTTIIAPSTIGDNSLIAAGSVITRAVEPESLAIARVEQKNIAHGATRYRNTRAKK